MGNFSQIAPVAAHKIRKVEPSALEPDACMARRHCPVTFEDGGKEEGVKRGGGVRVANIAKHGETEGKICRYHGNASNNVLWWLFVPSWADGTLYNEQLWFEMCSILVLASDGNAPPVVEYHIALPRSADNQLFRARGASTVHDAAET